MISVSGPLDHNEAAVMILTVRATDTNASTETADVQHDTSKLWKIILLIDIYYSFFGEEF